MQIKDNINAANLLSVAANMSGSGKPDGKQDGIIDGLESNDFASILSASSDKAKVSDESKEDKYDFVSKTVEKNQNNSGNSNKTEKNNKTSSVNNDEVEEKSRINSKKTDGNVSANDADAEVTEEEVEQISQVLASIVSLIEDKLGATIEDINNLMDQLSMDMGELLNEESIKDIFLNFESADISDILTDESLRDSMNELIGEFEQIIEELPVSVEEGVKLINDNDVKFDDVIALESNDTDEGPDAIIQNDNLNTPYVEVKYDSKLEQNNDKSGKKSDHNQDENTSHFENPILQGISDAVAGVEDVSSVIPNTRPAEIVKQIIEQVRVNINQDNTSMEMQLYPEHLGRIQINVVSKDGVMTARIAAETETARQAIEAGLNNLKESLENQNLKVDAIEVMVSTTGFASSDERQDDYQQQGTGNRSKRLNLSDLDEEISEEDEEIERMRATNSGSSVTYLA